MKALRAAEGQPPQPEIVELPVPAPGPHEALIRISAAGLNRADLLQSLGRYGAPTGVHPDILGIEFAGVVEQLGSNCSQTSVGRRVFGLANGGAHAEYIVSREELLVDAPTSMTDVEAAATAEAFITAHDALLTQASMRSGDTVLVHAAASSVGLAALQLAAVGGCQAFGTVRTPHKTDVLNGIVESFGLVPKPQICNADAFDDAVLARTNDAGVDIILDLVGAAYFQRNSHALTTRGRMICVGTMSGTAASLDLGLLLRKRLCLIGTVLRSRSLEEKIDATQAFVRGVMPSIASGRIGPIVDRTFSLDQAADAYRYMADNRNIGKIVLTMP